MSTKTNDSAALYNDNTNTPTNINTTVQAPITKDPEGNILEQYQDPQNDNQYATTPNTSTPTNKSNTGSGLDKATDLFEYSWDTKAEDRANLDYQKAILESKSNYLTNRQELETQGQQYQQNLDMQKYSQNQSNEKAGWTGGYILDTERQMAYLKQTIQSQMYGAMELQKYGYDTSLAAARLAYDTNKYDLALEYYNTALSRAVSEAEITGYYISPEVTEHLNQYSIASKKLNDGSGTERDQQIVDAVYKWFESNGISKQGVETLTHQEFINTLKMTAQSVANFQKGSDLLQIDNNSFGEVDANGNLIYSEDYEKVNTVHFDKMEDKDIIAYANRGELAKQQVMGYIESIIEEKKLNYLKNVATEKDGKTTYNVKHEDLINYIKENTNIVKDLINQAPDTFKNFTYETNADGIDLYITFKENSFDVQLNTDSQNTQLRIQKFKEQEVKESNTRIDSIHMPSSPDFNWNDGAAIDFGDGLKSKVYSKRNEVKQYLQALGIEDQVNLDAEMDSLADWLYENQGFSNDSKLPKLFNERMQSYKDKAKAYHKEQILAK
jgi:hypothetical protein